MPSSLTSVLWFVAVIAVIPLALWLLKRSALGGNAGSRPGVPRPVAVMAISAQQKLVTIEVGQGDERLWLVLGVSPQGIRTLHTMTAQDEAPVAEPQPPAAAFAQLLGRLKNEKPGAGHHGQ